MVPMNFCFYTSGYGYGHATRDIALLRELKARLPKRYSPNGAAAIADEIARSKG